MKHHIQRVRLGMGFRVLAWNACSFGIRHLEAMLLLDLVYSSAAGRPLA